MGVAVHGCNSDVLYEPWEMMADDCQPFTIFDEFWAK